jgi:hypothetical protein
MKKFFLHKDGSPRWTPYWVGVLVALVFALICLNGEIGLAFHRFFRAGVWMILGLAAGGYYLYSRFKAYENEQDVGKFGMHHFFFGLALVFIGVLGPLVGFKADRASNIPDEAVLHYNGHVINCCDPKGKNYYFKYYELSPADSLYVVTYNEEPGVNIHHAAFNCDTCTRSVNPRANEYGWYKITRHAAKLKGRY